jgi:hypothetical protein
MTVVIAHKFWKTVAVIADCRVSYLPPYDHKDDCLQKIYQVSSRLVLGFSGPLSGAHKVLGLVKENASNYPHPPVAYNLQKDVERWIRYEYRHLDEIERKDLSFMVATIEPHRERRAKYFKDGKEIPKPTWFPYVPEWSTLALIPSTSDPRELVSERKRLPKIIGLRREHRRAAEEVLMKFYGFASHQPTVQMQVVMNALKFELMARQLKEVGGLFQCALLNEQGVQWLGYSAPNVILQPEKGRFVQRNIITGQMLPLMSIWEWAEKRPAPGTFGTFEDPGLLEVVERMQKDADGTQPGPVSTREPGEPRDS